MDVLNVLIVISDGSKEARPDGHGYTHGHGSDHDATKLESGSRRSYSFITYS